MRKIDLKSLGVGLDEVKAALAREPRRGVRRRLVAIRRILAGKSIKQAARAAKATRGSVERWLNQVRRSGLRSLLLDRRRRYPKREMPPDQVQTTRREIAAALERQLKPQVRLRLVAIDNVLSGQPIENVALSALVRPNTVKDWFRVVTRDRLAPTLARWEGQGQARPRHVDADPVALRELAAKERNPRIRKRMLAIACVAEGMSPHAASMSTGLNHKAIAARMRRFRKEGIAAFHDRKIAGRPRKLDAESGAASTKPAPGKVPKHDLSVREPQAAASGVKNERGRPRKLSSAQLEELRDYVLKQPETSFWRLHHLVWNRFHVRHSHASLKRLLKSEFGIVWTGARKKLGEGLNLPELQDALADTTDWRTKDRLKALIDLAKGRDADTVARANGVHMETLRKWGKPYRRSGIEGLRGKQPERDGRPSKLSAEQRCTLTEWIVAEPEIDEDGLCARVKARFGVSYSPAHMRRLAFAARARDAG